MIAKEKSFVFQGEHEIRTITEGATQWFCATDVCNILGYTRARDAVRKNCNPKGASNRRTLTRGGEQSLLYINQPNVFRLIARSRKSEARKFEEWIFEVVLPEIARTGQYGAEEAIRKNEATVNILARKMQLEQEFNGWEVSIQNAKARQRQIRVEQENLDRELYGQHALPFEKPKPAHIGPGWKHK